MKFTEYVRKQQLREVRMVMRSAGFDPSDYDLDSMTEADLKKILAAGALATAPFISGAKHAEEAPEPAKPFTYQYKPMFHDAQKESDLRADKDYVKFGGKKYDAGVKEAQDFIKFRKTKDHRDILRKAGLPDDYVPTPIRNFVHGTEISSATVRDSMDVNLLEKDIKKHFGRESFVQITRSVDAVTGGTTTIADIHGHTMARNEQEARLRARMQVEHILKRHGFSTDGMVELTGMLPTVSQDMSRSTIDMAREASELTRFPFAFKVKLVKESGIG